METALEKAIRLLNGGENLGRALGVSKSAVSQWHTGGVPIDRCVEIEKLTSGEVTCEDLRPDKASFFAYLRLSRHTQSPKAA